MRQIHFDYEVWDQVLKRLSPEDQEWFHEFYAIKEHRFEVGWEFQPYWRTHDEIGAYEGQFVALDANDDLDDELYALRLKLQRIDVVSSVDDDIEAVNETDDDLEALKRSLLDLDAPYSDFWEKTFKDEFQLAVIRAKGEKEEDHESRWKRLLVILREFFVSGTIQSNEDEALVDEGVKATEKGFVYLVRNQTDYKIGITKDVLRRMNQLKAHELVHLVKCSNYRELEKELHNVFKEERIHGSEFFRLSPAQVEEAQRLMNKKTST